MADLVTRLRLDNKLFDDNIKKSEKLLKSFLKVGDSLGSAIKGIGILIGAAMGAFEVFDTAMNSNASTQRTWTTLLGTAKESVDVFFTALNTGDWSSFEDGLSSVIGLANDYVNALKNIAQIAKLGQVKMDLGEARLDNLENLVLNKNSSVTVRNQALEEYKKEFQGVFSEIQNSAKATNEEIQKMLNAKGIKFSNAKQMKSDILTYLDPSTKEYLKLMQYVSDHNRYNSNFSKWTVGDNSGEIWKNIKNDRMESLRKLYENFGEGEDTQLLLDLLDNEIKFQESLNRILKQYQDLLQEEIKDETKGTKKDTTPKFDKASLAALEEQITAKKNELRLAINEEDRARIYKELKDLEDRKVEIEFKYKYPDKPSNLDSKPVFLTSSEAPNWNKKIQKRDNPFGKKATKENNKYIDSLNAIGSIMGSITNMTNEGAAAWISWSANILSATAAAIPAIVAVTGAKKGEAIANGVASATQTPLVGWLLAGAAAASVIAALATIPTFANGGIFESSLTTGDRNLARLNGGEMILNKGQQYNLFKLLDNGTPINNGGKVTFKISGKELVGVLSNYNNKVSKVR